MGIPIFFFGEWEYGLIVGALIWTIGGTVFLIVLGLILRLVGIEYDLQKQEAAYRKILVIAEDDGNVRPKTIDELFDDVRKIHFLSYLRYLYFNIGRIAYLQANVLSAYVFLAPAIVAGAVTLGVMQQIIRAFNKVEGSFQYILKSWPQIIELASVYKRLREFEDKLKLSEEKDTIKFTRIMEGLGTSLIESIMILIQILLIFYKHLQVQLLLAKLLKYIALTLQLFQKL